MKTISNGHRKHLKSIRHKRKHMTPSIHTHETHIHSSIIKHWDPISSLDLEQAREKRPSNTSPSLPSKHIHRIPIALTITLIS